MDFSFFTVFSPGLVAFAALAVAFLIQAWYYLGVFSRLAFFKNAETTPHLPPASVIICARNEDDNLVQFLPKIFEQDYPDFEVVVVNDCSYDNTGDILKEFSYRHPNLKIVTIKEDEYYSHGKKIAVMMGIKGASHECLVFTDADCFPTGKNWLRNMVMHLSGETEIVLGYGAYEKTKGFLNKLIRFDTFMIGQQFLSFAAAGKTYMGTGRNMAYKKPLFFRMKGFASHYHIESGDDDLFVNEAATKKNVKVEVNPDSHTISRVKRTFKSWFRQKRRHITTFSHYNFGSKFRLTTISFSQYLFYAAIPAAIILKFPVWPVAAVFGLRLLIQLLIFNKSMRRLGEKDLLFLTPLFEIVLMFIYPFVPLANRVMKKNKWK